MGFGFRRSWSRGCRLLCGGSCCRCWIRIHKVVLLAVNQYQFRAEHRRPLVELGRGGQGMGYVYSWLLCGGSCCGCWLWIPQGRSGSFETIKEIWGLQGRGAGSTTRVSLASLLSLLLSLLDFTKFTVKRLQTSLCSMGALSSFVSVSQCVSPFVCSFSSRSCQLLLSHQFSNDDKNRQRTTGCVCSSSYMNWTFSFCLCLSFVSAHSHSDLQLLLGDQFSKMTKRRTGGGWRTLDSVCFYVGLLLCF